MFIYVNFYYRIFLYIELNEYGEVSEWFKVTASKTVVGATPPWVQIPPSPNGTGVDFSMPVSF